MKGANAYRRTSVSTADPMDIVIALYDGLLRHLHAAQLAFEASKRAQAGERIGKALAIINELDASLDTQTTNKFSQQLHALYAWFEQELLTASLKNDATKLAPVVLMVSELRDAWHAAATGLRTSGTSVAKTSVAKAG